MRPIFSGRDSVIKYDIAQIEPERRNGYAWYGGWGAKVAVRYGAWAKNAHRQALIEIISFLPRQQNLWARSGSGRCPRLCKRASFATFAVLKPYDFLVTSFTLLLRPSTAPAETCPRARNQFRISGR